MNYELFMLLFVVICIREGFSIKCYECNSARDPNCGDPFSSDTIEAVDCDSYRPGKNATFCRKNAQKTTLNGKTDTRIVRACGWIADRAELEINEDDPTVTNADGSSCFNRAGTFEVAVTYCKCGAEVCNSVDTNAPSYVTTMTLTALASSTLLFTSALVLL